MTFNSLFNSYLPSLIKIKKNEVLSIYRILNPLGFHMKHAPYFLTNIMTIADYPHLFSNHAWCCKNESRCTRLMSNFFAETPKCSFSIFGLNCLYRHRDPFLWPLHLSPIINKKWATAVQLTCWTNLRLASLPLRKRRNCTNRNYSAIFAVDNWYQLAVTHTGVCKSTVKKVVGTCMLAYF